MIDSNTLLLSRAEKYKINNNNTNSHRRRRRKLFVFLVSIDIDGRVNMRQKNTWTRLKLNSYQSDGRKKEKKEKQYLLLFKRWLKCNNNSSIQTGFGWIFHPFRLCLFCGPSLCSLLAQRFFSCVCMYLFWKNNKHFRYILIIIKRK